MLCTKVPDNLLPRTGHIDYRSETSLSPPADTEEKTYLTSCNFQEQYTIAIILLLGVSSIIQVVVICLRRVARSTLRKQTAATG